MARTRSIKPEFWDDEKLAKVSRDARLLFAGMWGTSDDYGVTKGNAAYLKSRIFPYDDIPISEIQAWLKDLRAIRCIIPFEAGGEAYYFIPNFLKHQKIDHPSLQRNPAPPDNIRDSNQGELLMPSGIFANESRDARESIGQTVPQTETETETETETNDCPPKGEPASSAADLKKSGEMADEDKPNSEFRRITDYFNAVYERKFTEPYEFKRAKDGKAARELLRRLGFDKLRDYIDLYFETDDAWINKQGREWSKLNQNINLLKQLAAVANNGHKPKSAGKTSPAVSNEEHERQIKEHGKNAWPS